MSLKWFRSMIHQPRGHFFIAALSGAWLFAVTVGASGEEAMTPQPPSVATQAGAAAVQNFTEFLKAEAARAQEATRHDSEVIEHALTTFKWIVGVVGALVLAGATVAGWMMAAWNRTTITGIFQDEIKTQVQARFREVDSEITRTLTRVVALTDELSKQQDIIAKLVTMTTGVFPYAYLKDIYNKKMKKDPNQVFIFQDQNAFKRELGFLIDNGFIENINLDLLEGGHNILDKLTITEAGRLLIALRENRTPATA
jgi:hypothetical protein